MRDSNFTSLSVPGSILLAGEYAILEPGGLGLAVAAPPRVHVTWQSSDDLCILARFQDIESCWSPQSTGELPILDQAWMTLKKQPDFPCHDIKASIMIDSTALSRPDNRKAGYGSSAAAAVAATAALLYLAAKQPPSVLQVFETALTAHRSAHNGLGSGYDVACSTFGGLGLFQGGAIPSWTSLVPCHGIHLKLLCAPEPVSTHQAIESWQRWKMNHPALWFDLFSQSQAIVQGLVTAQNSDVFQTRFQHAAIHTQQLGQTLGVWHPENHAFIKQQTGVCKALGAGNELLAQICDRNDPNRIDLMTQGVTWS